MSTTTARAETSAALTPEETAYKLDVGLSHLHHDLESLAWACEALWHYEFKYGQDNEHLSRFPVAIIRMLALRTAPLADYAEKLADTF